MKVAILGYSKSGKKTLFTLLSGRHIPPGRQESEVVEGNALVRDPRVDEITKIAKPQKVKYAETVFALCPDIVDGGSRAGWLEAAKKADMLCLVVRSFMSDSVYHPAGSVDLVFNV